MPFTSSVTAQWHEKSGGTAGTLTLSNGGGTSMTFNLSGSYSATSFTVASDGHGGTLCTEYQQAAVVIGTGNPFGNGTTGPTSGIGIFGRRGKARS
jgi:hypothetical protein